MHHKAMVGCTSCRLVSIAEDMNPSNRQTMEDCILARDGFAGRPEDGLFGVYDGHGGRDIVEFIEHRLHRNIERELAEPDDDLVELKLARAFLITDYESHLETESTSGATAVVCYLTNDPTTGERELFTANVGDSRAVLCRNGKAERLSTDHKPSSRSEQERIEACGGFVHKNRAMGILAVSRSFGDHKLKKYITARPSVMRTRLDALDDTPFIILACDGVWDVFDDQEAVDLVRKYMGRTGKEEEVARLLIEEALERDSTDNISAVVVYL